jgi:hypothetical protein
MSTALQLQRVERAAGALARIDNIEDLQTLAQIFVKSGFFQDAKDAAQAIVKVMAGAELGFPAIASMTGIYIVKGKVSMSANLMAAAIKRSGKYNFRVKQLDTQAAEIQFFEDGQPVGVSRFTMVEAKGAHLADSPTWQKFPRNMLYARAMSNGAKWFCPDIFGGPVYTPDELGMQTSEEGEAVEVRPEPVVEVLPAHMSEAAQDAHDAVMEMTGAYDPESDIDTAVPRGNAPELFKSVRLEGAQPTHARADELPTMTGNAAHVLGLARQKGWNAPVLAQAIEAKFGVVVMPGQLTGYFECATKEELRELYRAIKDGRTL